ncbi:hypothetical protein PENTCL1PPCAC_12166, partial [Pristionchus entomophagus]
VFPVLKSNSSSFTSSSSAMLRSFLLVLILSTTLYSSFLSELFGSSPPRRSFPRPSPGGRSIYSPHKREDSLAVPQPIPAQPSYLASRSVPIELFV